MQAVYKNIEEHNPGRKCNILIVVDDMIVDIISNKKLNQIVSEISIRGRKLNITFILLKQSYFAVSKD